VGVGSTFCLNLPLLASTSAAPAPVANLRGLQALILDRSATNRRVLQTYLGAAGIRHSIAASAEDAIERVAASKIDVLILESGLPDGDSERLISALRLLPGLATLGCVMIGSAGESPPARRGDCVEWLMRPLRENELLAAIATLTDRRTAGTPATVSSILRAQSYPAARVLLVEDNPVNQEVAARLVETFGIRATLCVNGEEAVNALSGAHFDLVLMDCQMPVMDGFVATRAIRELEAGANRPRTPIVALTANAMPGDRERCLDAGMDDYLTKPFRRESLGAVLARWLAPSELAAALPTTPPSLPRAAPEPAGALNVDALTQLRDVFDGDISGVVGAYLSDAQTQINAMASALERQAGAELERAAHSLKSTSRSVGADAVAGLCAELETLARNEDYAASAKPLLQQIRERFAIAAAALNAERSVPVRIPAA